MKYRYTKGQAAIICGNKGTGRSQTAIRLAEKEGDYIFSSFDKISELAGLQELIKLDAKTVIIDEFESTPENLVLAKMLITIENLPNFIFCTGCLPDDIDERRFFIINIEDRPEIFNNLMTKVVYGKHDSMWYELRHDKWEPATNIPANHMKKLNPVLWGRLYENFDKYLNKG